MRPPVPSLSASAYLRRLLTPHALDFGARLLRAGNGGTIHFREFLAVARDFVRERPEQSAVYLATLVALDMHVQDGDARDVPSRPSVN